jgi:hypothetical protein
MSRTPENENQTVFTWLSRKWWFYIMLAGFFFLPIHASKPFDSADMMQVLITTLSQPIIYSLPPLFFVTKLIPIGLALALLLWKGRAARLFSGYAALLYVAIALFQNSAITEEYGLSTVPGNMILMLVVAAFWIWETVSARQNKFEPQPASITRLWLLPLVLFAFWYPIDMQTVSPDFAPLKLFTNEAGVTFCMMTPFFLTVMLLFFPSVNRATLQVTGFVGLLMGLVNMMSWFVFEPYAWWMGVLHIPLFATSLFAFAVADGWVKLR